MRFNSFVFIGFIAIVFLLYYFIAKKERQQVWILITASLVFYGYQEPFLVLLLLFSAGINIAVSFYITRLNSYNSKILAITGVAFNIAILAFFKYSEFFASQFLHNDTSISRFLLKVAVPIGVSFYTFEGISLVVDVYKEPRNMELVKPHFFTHARNALFFISFFPHLVSGPILKANNFLPQIRIKKIAEIPWEECFKNLVTGYFLKMVVADNLKDLTFWIAHPYFLLQSSYNLILMPFGYLIQIFADFAGYSLIAVGVAKLFGYQLIYNFNFPFISTSFREFWRRWNISLSLFLTTYLYIPLGGNRKGNVRTYFNIIITMLIGGLWHGATLSFALWGLFHGLALSVERVFDQGASIKKSSIIKFLSGVLVFTLVAVIGLLFKLSPAHLVLYFKSITGNFNVYYNRSISTYIVIYSLPVVLYHWVHFSKSRNYSFADKNKEYLWYATMIFLIIANSGPSNSFIYFQF